MICRYAKNQLRNNNYKNRNRFMKTQLALLSIVVFTSAVGIILYFLGVGDHHTNPLWAFGTAVVFLVVLLIDVWMFFAIAKEDAYKWDV